MLEKYKTVYEGGEGEMVEKKSRFIATVRPVSTEEEALAFIEENNELVDEKFIPINKVRWLKDELKESNKLFKKYFLNKLKKFNNIVAV